MTSIFNNLIKKGRRKKIQIIFIFILFYLVIVIFGTVGLYWAEHKKNPEIDKVWEALWKVVLFFFSGIEKEPLTTEGRIISAVFSIIGNVTIGGVIVGTVVTILYKMLNREVKMPTNTREHIVICNWNERGDKIVNELHHPEAEPHTRIVIITSEKVNEEELRQNDRYENVYFVYGDPTIHSSLEKGANAHLAKCVVILADDKCPDPDGKTALIALAIEKLAKNKNLPSPRILAEVKNHRKIEHLKDAGVDEWICATDYGLGILAQCVFSPKLTEVYHQLLTFGEETCEIYFIPPEKIPDFLYGKTFEEIADFFNKNRDDNNPSILLGVKREGRIILNPRRAKDEFGKLERSDSLIVLAYTWPQIGPEVK